MSCRVREIRRVTYKSASIDVVFRKNGQVVLEYFSAEEKRKGHGRECLNLVEKYADENGLTLRLKANRYGNEPSPQNNILVEMYASHGFVLDPSYAGMKPPRMIRKPRSSTSVY